MGNYCLVSYGNIYCIPYAEYYINEITNTGNECTLLFWDRDEEGSQNDNYPSCNKIVFKQTINNTTSFAKKLVGYFRSTFFFKKVLRKGKFDGIVFLQTHGAVACESVVRRYYKNRYIVEIRDYSLEKFGLFRKKEKKTIYDSFATIISSPAFQTFLPEYNYVVAHNYSSYSSDVVKEVRDSSKKNDNTINLSFIGNVRFIEINKKVLDLFKNDYRFRICYFGNGSDILKQYCIDNNILNVSFCGRFAPQKTTDLYSKTNLINNIYGNHNLYLDFALSNKLYYAATFHIPIIVCPETYMEEITSKYGIGFSINLESKNEPDRLYEWYKSLNREDFNNGCDRLINRVIKDNEYYYKIIKDFLDDNEYC